MTKENLYRNPLNRDFFERKTEEVARQLLGCILVREVENSLLSGRIVEVEAYLPDGDPAAHAFIGQTLRNKVLFGQAGFSYVFRIHGQNCLNVVAEPEGIPGCVLIRALEPVGGIDLMRNNRKRRVEREEELTNGPGKLCQSLRIDLNLNGVDLTYPGSPLIVCGSDGADIGVVVTRRVGITKAADEQLRFTIKGNRFVSK